jgi:hypothetical protein
MANHSLNRPHCAVPVSSNVSHWDEYLYSSIVDDCVDISCSKNFFADRYGMDIVSRELSPMVAF